MEGGRKADILVHSLCDILQRHLDILVPEGINEWIGSVWVPHKNKILRKTFPVPLTG
jgi:hypothetical protein